MYSTQTKSLLLLRFSCSSTVQHLKITVTYHSIHNHAIWLCVPTKLAFINIMQKKNVKPEHCVLFICIYQSICKMYNKKHNQIMLEMIFFFKFLFQCLECLWCVERLHLFMGSTVREYYTHITREKTKSKITDNILYDAIKMSFWWVSLLVFDFISFLYFFAYVACMYTSS